MKTKKPNIRSHHREKLFFSLLGLGFNPVAIRRFFDFLTNRNKESEKLASSVECGVKGLFSGNRSDGTTEIELSRAHRGIDLITILDRYELTHTANHVTSLFIPVAYLDCDLTLVKASNNITPDPSNQTLKKKVYTAFFNYYFSPEIFNPQRAKERMRQVVKYWRGILESHRVVLQLDGMNSYNDDIMQADKFLKILESEGRATVKKLVKK